MALGERRRRVKMGRGWWGWDVMAWGPHWCYPASTHRGMLQTHCGPKPATHHSNGCHQCHSANTHRGMLQAHQGRKPCLHTIVMAVTWYKHNPAWQHWSVWQSIVFAQLYWVIHVLRLVPKETMTTPLLCAQWYIVYADQRDHGDPGTSCYRAPGKEDVSLLNITDFLIKTTVVMKQSKDATDASCNLPCQTSPGSSVACGMLPLCMGLIHLVINNQTPAFLCSQSNVITTRYTHLGWCFYSKQCPLPPIPPPRKWKL